MRVNEIVQSHIDFTKYQFESWLDIGTAEGLVAQEWRYLQSISRKVAIDPGTYQTDLDRGFLFQFLDDKWEKYQEEYNENSSLYDQDFDLITLMDTIQYYYKPDGIKLLEHLCKKVKKMLIIWTPSGYYPHPGHVSCWHISYDFLEIFNTELIKGFHDGPPIKADAILVWKVW